ncbi:hypothetical protein K1T35_32020 [Pseudonocardia sp. DSM 110487]|uniref:DUF5995 family protein n=1 Tax=Pseudonocardia sp. DSM 110487 TaxID=2865833 RepID=UPI001C6A69BC|nr:DUF5995 family protein [Pseudonocardia sp. DSM 110487]QYN33134.1 hypothetical protein K1T35_32020 [Pseudonocardia sp. DSM 110487]
MLVAIESEAVETGDPDRPGGVVDAVAGLQEGADAGVRGHGAGPVGRLLTAVAAPDDAAAQLDTELRAALVAELARRYLRAVRAHARGSGAPRVWQVLLTRWEGGTGDPARTALAGAHALVCFDLPPAVVSACTLLGLSPGPVEQAVVQAVTAQIARLANEAAATDSQSRDDASGLALLLSRSECWRQAEHLWTLRGRPSEAEKERAALDWRAALVARALLGSG